MDASASALLFETKTQEIARQLLAISRDRQSIFSQIRDQMRWDDKLLAWAMDNPGLRVQLFRLIDCLPSLQSNAEIARHLQEYLGQTAVELPAALKSLLNFANPDSLPGQLAATTVSTAVKALAQKYIAGASISEVIKTVERLRKEEMMFTVDLLGEAVITELEAQSYLDGYLELIEQLTEASKQWPKPIHRGEAEAETLLPVQVSVKLTAFYSQFDPLDAKGSQVKVSDRIRTLLRRAKELGAAIHFDMEQYQYKRMTLMILKQLLMDDEFRTRTDLGITIQAYLRDSYTDLQDLVAWVKQRGSPLTVRLVKGAYCDQEIIKAAQNGWPTPVFNDKPSTDANFEVMTRLLLENHQYLYAAIGSHNVRSQAHAIAIAEVLKIPPRRFECQVLYGMADRLAKAIVDKGYRVRVYCPYGALIPGMSYLIRRLLENTANSSFLRQTLEDRPIEELLARPEQTEAETSFPKISTDGRPAVGAQEPSFYNAPNTDYALTTHCQAVQQALQQVRQQLGKTYLPLVDGEYLQTEIIVDSLNPSLAHEVVGHLGLISIAQADRAIAAAKTAFLGWKRTPASVRANILRRVADLMEQRRQELIAWMCLETGKVVREADPEVSEAIDFCRYYADEMERLGRGIAYDYPGETNRYSYQPRGICLVISPWNFPLAIPTGMTVASLVAGNCTLLKPAEASSVIAAKLAEILVEAGVPKGVFQFIPAQGSTVGSYLVKHPDVQMIAFTGSQAVGCRIYRDAAELQPGQNHLKRVIAEMGGKNAIIVDESADLDQAVQGVVQSAFGYSGQKCSACSRVIVLEPVYNQFLKRLVEATQSLSVGIAENPASKVGPVIDATARDRIREYIDQGKLECELALEMPAPEGGFFVGPTIFHNVSPTAAIAQEEIFGPVLSVMKARTFREALDICNSTRYALTGGLYSRTPSHIAQAQAEFEVGNLYINRGITGAIVARQPFGGFKLSGVGSKAGGPDYLLQFLEPKVITENIQRQGFAPIEGVDS